MGRGRHGVRVELSEDECRVLAALDELGAATVSDIAGKTLRPTAEVEARLQRLKLSGVLRTDERQGIESKIYSVTRQFRGSMLREQRAAGRLC